MSSDLIVFKSEPEWESKYQRMKKCSVEYGNSYNSCLFYYTHNWFIFDITNNLDKCFCIANIIKDNQKFLRSRSGSIISILRTQFKLPTFNKIITLSTDFGLIQITALSKNGIDLDGFRISEPKIDIKWCCRERSEVWGFSRIFYYIYNFKIYKNEFIIF